MESRINEQNLSSNMNDLIDPSDKYKLEEYISFLKCHKCSDIMAEPKSCPTCEKILCSKCKMEVCAHTLMQSRHLKSLLENINFKCKFNQEGCQENLKYFDIRSHIITCKYAIQQKLIVNKNNNFLNNQSSLPFNASCPIAGPNRNKSFFIDTPLFPENSKVYNFRALSSTYEGKVHIKCSKCDNTFLTKNDFTIHLKLCDLIENLGGQNENQNEESNRQNEINKLNEEFYQKFERVKNRFITFQNEKKSEYYKTFTNKINSFLANLNEKKIK